MQILRFIILVWEVVTADLGKLNKQINWVMQVTAWQQSIE